MKQYSQLPLPVNSSWDRKTYNPISLFRSWVYTNWRYSWLDKLLDNIINPVNNFFEGIANIIKWAPIIYKDKNWDDHYIFEILKFKLIQQRKYLVENNRHMGIEQINKYITLCLNLIERVQEEYYGMEYMDYHINKYNWLDADWSPDARRLEIHNISENYDDYFKKYPNTHRKILIEGNKHYNEWNRETQAMELGRVNQKRCQDLLFKILNEKINSFWD